MNKFSEVRPFVVWGISQMIGIMTVRGLIDPAAADSVTKAFDDLFGALLVITTSIMYLYHLYEIHKMKLTHEQNMQMMDKSVSVSQN